MGVPVFLTKAITESFDRSIALYADLIESIDESTLESKLPGLRSNALGLQLWCVVGARESYARAIEANEWSGFSCSLEAATVKTSVAEALERSGNGVTAVLGELETVSDVQARLVVDLLEHEAAHHGQLIRYLYGLGLAIPASWKARYALD